MAEKKQTDKKNDEALSFEAITAEIGDVTIPVEADEQNEPDDALPPDFFPDTGGTVPDDAAPAAKTAEESDMDRINRRVLTGCSPETRHMYVEGVFCGVLAALFMAPIILRTGFVQYQPWFSYFSFLLASGATIWSLSGLQVETKVEGRRMCVVSAVFCAAVAVVALWFRNVS
ncbi:MAG TPA: hypothetical protein ENN29_11385 [Candidatus Hydrogenedentes bacterium]|nr:hypothetical protein [Candidatus Hydrogenedentota bacterium]